LGDVLATLMRPVPEVPTIRNSVAPISDKKIQALIDKSKEYDVFINKSAAKYGIDPFLLKGLIAAESRFDPYVSSVSGAYGLCQLLPSTAKGLGFEGTITDL